MGVTEAAWRRRFRLPVVALPQWAHLRPDRVLYRSNVSGKLELHAWDRATDVHRQVTDRPEGTTIGQIDPSGEAIYWFQDLDGDEFGLWMVESFDGGELRSAFEGIAKAYSTGLALGTDAVVVGSSSEAGSQIHALQPGSAPRLVYQHAQSAWLSGVPRWWMTLPNLSSDQGLFAFHHSEHGDSRHPAVRVCDLSGARIAELWDGPGLGLTAGGWSPVPGDARLVVHHERDGTRRPLIWEPRHQEVVDPHLDLPGEVEASWYPDGTALLLEHDHAGRTELLKHDLETGSLSDLGIARGSAANAAVRPDGDVWYVWSDATRPYEVRSTSGGVVVRLPGDPPPSSVPYGDLRAGAVPAFVAEPPTPRPHPTIFLIHGGPDAHESDEFSAWVQSWIDHGIACVLVNYRGSTGYGRAWRDAITGNPGFTELGDIAAVADRVVADGIADPKRLILGGGSWGGYLTLLGLGIQAERWSLGIAAVPVADYVAAYEDEMEPLKAYDRALFGASPSEDPELYRLRSPITYVEQVAVPIFVLVGENDPRCPVRQIDNYLEQLEAQGKPHEVLRFGAGHGSKKVDEEIRQVESMIDFVSRYLGTPAPQ
jgi:acetyl esterase/lipase